MQTGAEERYRHDGDVSNEWELVARERLSRAASAHRRIELLRDHAPWYAEGVPPQGGVDVDAAVSGRDALRLPWNSGAALLSILGVIYPRDSVAEMALSVAERDDGWEHKSRSALDRIDHTLAAGARWWSDPIEDVPAMWRDLERDRAALWKRIRALSGYDLTAAQTSPDGEF